MISEMPSPFPSVFKEGWLRDQKMSRSVLSRADGVVSNTSRSPLILFEITTPPVCGVKEASQLLLSPQPPLLENGGEWS
jgi:hypothetical protein